jgi:uncharacterized membrane protein YtjA (UPF0391 family)
MRRWALVLCLVVVLLCALTFAGIAFPIAILAPLWFFFATVLCDPIRSFDEPRNLQPAPALPLFSPRPPPHR